MKRLSSLLLSVLMIISTSTIALAEESNSPNITPVILEAEPTVFSVTVSTGLPVWLSANGEVTTSDNIHIQNNSIGPVIIKDVRIEGENGWKLQEYEHDFSKDRVNTKSFGFEIFDSKVNADGSSLLETQHIPGKESLNIKYNAKLPPQSNQVEENIAHAIFIVGWDKADNSAVDISSEKLSMEPESTEIITLSFSDIESDKAEITWSSSNELVATVEPAPEAKASLISGERSCIVKAISPGKSIITGTLANGKSKSTEVTVNKPITLGEVYKDENYEYRYGQYYWSGTWNNIQGEGSEGWGVRLLKNNLEEYPSPLTEIHGKPVTSMYGLFHRSTAKSIVLNNWDTHNVVDMHSMFTESKAENLDISSLDTENVVNMMAMFSDSSVKNIDLSGLNTSKVKYMNGMFYQSKATSINLSGIDTFSVEDMNRMFYSCPATILNGISELDTSNVTNMSEMFYYSGVLDLDLSKFNTSRVTSMKNMFSSCEAITLDVSNFNTSNVTDMQGMFYDTKATSLNLSSFDTSKVTEMGSMFSSSEVTSLDLRNFNTYKVTNMSGMFNYTKATNINLSSFNTSNVINMSYMFANSRATVLDLSRFNTLKVKNMTRMFSDSNVKTIDLRSFNLVNTTSTDAMFLNAKATTGYARTQAEADIYNATYNKPATLTFIVK